MCKEGNYVIQIVRLHCHRSARQGLTHFFNQWTIALKVLTSGSSDFVFTKTFPSLPGLTPSLATPLLNTLSSSVMTTEDDFRELSD